MPTRLKRYEYLFEAFDNSLFAYLDHYRTVYPKGMTLSPENREGIKKITGELLRELDVQVQEGGKIE